MTTGWLLLFVVLVIAFLHSQTAIDDEVCDNVEDDCNSVQDTQQQLLQTRTSRLGKRSGTNSNSDKPL